MANTSILSILELARPALPASLIDSLGYENVAAIAGQLPGQLTTFWGFECRLGETDARADILFENSKQSRGSQLLAGQISSSLDALCQAAPAWHNLRKFAALWINSDHLFQQYVKNIWLEFDTASAASPSQAAAIIHQPNIFFGLGSKLLPKEQLYKLIKNALAVFEHDIGDDHYLRAFVAALPEEAELFQIGIMMARKSAALRVCVQKINPAEIPSWLGRLQWPGAKEAVASLLHLVMPIAQVMAVDLNMTQDGMTEKIGLECYMDWLVDEPDQWNPLLELISEKQLCLAAKRKGIMEFPGITRTPDNRSPQGGGLIYLDLFRKIHHIKLTLSGSQPAEAKAYLALSRPALNLDRSVADQRDAWLLE
jgi:hypothetical protein